MATTLLLDPAYTGDISLPLSAFCTEVRKLVSSTPKFSSSFRLISVAHYKEKDHIGHEFLILDVYHSESRQTFKLRAERRPSTEKLPVPSLEVASNFSYVRKASDTICRTTTPMIDKERHWISTIRLPSTPYFTLLHICGVYQKVFDMGPLYSLRQNQCYWFCRTFLELVKEYGDVKETKGKDCALAGKFVHRVGVTSESSVKGMIRRFRHGAKEQEDWQRERKKLETKLAFKEAVASQKQQNDIARAHIREALRPLLRTSKDIPTEQK